MIRPMIRAAARRLPAVLLLAPAAAGIGLSLALTPPAAAQSALPDARAARAMLYRADRAEVSEIALPGIDATQRETLLSVARSQPYYAAMAFAPAVGVIAEPTVIAANYHSVEAARTAALAQCNARRSGGAACEIALEVRPAGFEPRALTLSSDATSGFERDYRRARGARVFAVSAATGNWGVGRGDAAELEAIAACARGGSATDCRAVIRD